MSPGDRFRAKYTVSETGCWLWTGSLNNMGYGQFRDSRRLYLSHRWSFAKANGPITAGMNVLHKCDVPACCNPEHLELGTQTKNIRDAHTRGLCSHPVKVSKEDVDLIRLAYETLPVQQKDLAKAWGISAATVSRFVNYQERA